MQLHLAMTTVVRRGGSRATAMEQNCHRGVECSARVGQSTSLLRFEQDVALICEPMIIRSMLDIGHVILV
jgi:hypothetical protein